MQPIVTDADKAIVTTRCEQKPYAATAAYYNAHLMCHWLYHIFPHDRHASYCILMYKL